VQDAARVRGFEGARGVEQPAQANLEGDLRISHHGPERPPQHELHRDERRSVELPDVVDGDGVDVSEARGGARFPEHAIRAAVGLVGIGQTVQPQDLEGHVALKLLVTGAVDAPHPSLAQERLDDVTIEATAAAQIHRACSS
jgi:hypothetical protein